ncbi:MAG: hypothetical protein U0636_00155 [Phycisphaerales bacterium]
MITKPTLFILGAGASAPFSLPIGVDLMADLEMRLGSQTETVLLLERAGFSREKIQELHDAITGGFRDTIDDLLDRRRSLTDVGKAAIAAALLDREHPTALRGVRGGNWVGDLLRRMHNKDATELLDAPVAFVTFNYDRCVEFALCNTLANRHDGMSLEQAATALRASKLWPLHLRGHLGLPIGTGPDLVPFKAGPPSYEEVMAAAKNLRLLHEQHDGDKEVVTRTEELAKWAEQIFVLGFGYAESNIALLSLGHVRPTIEVHSTTWGLSDERINRARGLFAPEQFVSHPTDQIGSVLHKAFR